MADTEKFTVRDFFNRFPNDDACLEHVMEVRFGLRHVCRACGMESTFHRLANRKAYTCARCGEPWDAYEVFHEFEEDEKEDFLTGNGCPVCGKSIASSPKTVEAWAESLLEATDDPDPLLERIELRLAQIQKPSQ